MLNSPRLFKDTCTMWPTNADGQGGFTFGTPVVLNCNWSDKEEIHYTRDGEAFYSRSVVYIKDTDVGIGDYLTEGDKHTITDPTTLTNKAFRVRAFNRGTDLRNLESIRKAIL